MGIWSGIKYALNSTLGTADFKPLDKIIEDIINKNKSLAPSDTVYKTMSTSVVRAYGGREDGPEYVKVGSSFTAKVTGSVRIKANLESGGQSGSSSGAQQFYVAKSTLMGDSPNYIAKIDVPDSTDTYTIFEVDINITKGTTYSFYIGTNSVKPYDIRSNGIWICANVVDGSLIS